jgi:hypothetical protein
MAKILSLHRPSLTSIVYIHNQIHPTINPHLPHDLNIVLKIITNTHMDTYPIKPTPIKYNIKISKTWKTTPEINNTLTTHLPSTYNHTYPVKYHPQQCIYREGSFISPSKNVEGQIVGNTAGSVVYSPNNNTQISKRLPGY